MTNENDQLEATKRFHPGQEYSPLEEPQLENPYPFYTQARRQEPIFFSERLDAWIVTRYDDVKSILTHPEIFSSQDTLRPVVAFTPEVLQVLATGYGFVPTIINTDGEAHQRFRVPLDQAFAPRHLKSIAGNIHKVADRLVDEFAADKHADLIAQFAVPLPVEIILALFGIPQEDSDQCKKWSDEAHALTSSPLPPDRQIACAQSFVALQHYLADLIEKRREEPGDDVASCLLTIHDDGVEPLTMAEMVISLLGVLLAGHETTTGLIGTTLYLLLSQREHWQYLCKHPEAIPLTIEEVLRFDSPVQTFMRTALREVKLEGITIPKDARLYVAYGSANRDEAQFSRADQFDLHRSPNRHMAFGYGDHVCVGAPLARLEGRIALEVLTRRLPGLRLKPQQEFSHHTNLMFRIYKRLEAEWDDE